MKAERVRDYSGYEVKIVLETGENLFGILRRTNNPNSFTVERKDNREIDSKEVKEILLLKS